LKIALISGFLGSGKTTTILRILKKLGQKGIKAAVIVNNLSGVPVDGMVFRESGLKVKEIGGGCICCELTVNLARTIKLLKEAYDPDVVLIEPTGLALPGQVAWAITSSGAKVEPCPMLVLFDIASAEELLDEERLGYLVARQLKDAEVIAINKIDLVEENKVAKYETILKSMNPSAQIVRVSVLKEIGLDELALSLGFDEA
jgi:G3E family GTPase